ncbi:MAG TPA: 2-phospho-L-lactate transferase [Candidatus Limnocylindrales bacterium]|jgi:LPPG:FO 2-phospho-L-lactate transferase|nr:2-phospho-L-lactate transferase [Candidatus Limnocylindrales bacterium]
MSVSGSVVLLAGGVGGAKLAHGLQARVGSRLVVVVNTADDVERHGLLVSPDHDTVLYTLAGIANREWGWGIEGETFATAAMLERYGEETWFRLGDRDLATHIVRTARLRRGDRPTDISRDLQRALGVDAVILPMTDASVRTEVLTDDGWLAFQDYFVRLHQEPAVRDLRFSGIEDAAATPEVEAALEAAEAILIAPSNPFVSVRPILAVAGIEAGLQTARTRGVRVVAVSGIVGGKALKGPADRMLASLGHEASALGVARQYTGIADAFVIDAVDAGQAAAIEELGMDVLVTETIMSDDAGRVRLATEMLGAAGSKTGA